jgi:hypothetical protein
MIELLKREAPLRRMAPRFRTRPRVISRRGGGGYARICAGSNQRGQMIVAGPSGAGCAPEIFLERERERERDLLERAAQPPGNSTADTAVRDRLIAAPCPPPVCTFADAGPMPAPPVARTRVLFWVHGPAEGRQPVVPTGRRVARSLRCPASPRSCAGYRPRAVGQREHGGHRRLGRPVDVDTCRAAGSRWPDAPAVAARGGRSASGGVIRLRTPRHRSPWQTALRRST